MSAVRYENRRPDIDWLRVLATYLLFVFHTAKVYDVSPFYQLKNGELSPSLDIFTGFIHQWHMPLFFLLAGWSVFPSLRKRKARGFVRERSARLFLPFALGCIWLCPPLQYVYARTALGYTGTFFEFVPEFFTSLKYFSWSHLWFLIYLFTFALLYLPLFVWLTRRQPSPRRKKRWLLYAPLPVLVLIQLSLRPIWPGWMNLYDDWANFTYYSVFFISGFLLSRSEDLRQALRREWRRAGWICLAAQAALFTIHVLLTLQWPRTLWAIFAIASFTAVMFLLGLADHLIHKTHRWLPYLVDSAMPIYILHQGFIILIGVFIVQLPWPIAAKYPVHLLAAVAATLAAYHFLVRPFNIVRVIMGARRIKPARGQGME